MAAAMLHTALHGDEQPAVILTYAWDRLLVDPRPGPRGTDDFTGLVPLCAHVHAVPPEARPVPPGGSTLPRLAAELPHTFALLDPYQGAVGITRQLEELVRHFAPDSVVLLDVGGDILARGDEPTLRSPLADGLTLAACGRLGIPVRLLIAGPGLDGELPADVLRPLLGPLVHSFGPADAKSVEGVLTWHPSEATGMLAAAARGVRGTCEVRDAGLQVPLTDESPTVHEADLGDALNRNSVARAVATTTTLAEAEARSRAICGFSEIDHEREKAARLTARPATVPSPAEVLSRLARFEAEARGRGATHTTFRRLSEALNLGAADRQALRSLLIGRRPEQCAAPLWRIRAD